MTTTSSLNSPAFTGALAAEVSPLATSLLISASICRWCDDLATRRAAGTKPNRPSRLLNTTSLFLSGERKSRSGRDPRTVLTVTVLSRPEQARSAVQGEVDRVRAVFPRTVTPSTPPGRRRCRTVVGAAWAHRQLKPPGQVPCSSMAKCDNPMCSCDPCGCVSCACGATRLGDLERRVMDTLWEQPTREMTGRDVADTLPESAYTTVATVLDRLVHKGLVRRRMERGAIQFSMGTRAASPPFSCETPSRRIVSPSLPSSVLPRPCRPLKPRSFESHSNRPLRGPRVARSSRRACLGVNTLVAESTDAMGVGEGRPFRGAASRVGHCSDHSGRVNPRSRRHRRRI